MAGRERPIPGERLGNAGDDLGPVLQFMKQLWALDHGLQSASKRMKATYGITGPQRLESRGVLHRRPDPKDARRALFGLTPRGRHVDALRTGTIEQAVRRVLERMPEDVLPAERLLAALTSELDLGLSGGLVADP